MTLLAAKRASIIVNRDLTVSGLAIAPVKATCCLVLAHGAGAGMEHPSMEALATGLAERSIATLRYQFPYMENHSRRPDPAKLCHQTIRAAVAKAHELMPTLPLFAGGKSFGGRMTSQAQSSAALPHVLGLCFFGFPLHPPQKPSLQRAEHLAAVQVPLLFLQGTRDALADLELVQRTVSQLQASATLKILQHADHSFHVLVRSGRNDAEVLAEMLDTVSEWMAGVLALEPRSI